MLTTDSLNTPTRIRLAMTALKLNQSDLADKMSVTRASVSSWLNRDIDRRTAISASALETMAGVLRVTPDWIVGVSETGGPDMDLSLKEELRHELEYLPTKEQFLKQIRTFVDEEAADFLAVGFDDCSIGYMGEGFSSSSLEFDYVNGSLVLALDISKKTTRTLDTLTELVWPLFIAKKIDEINGKKHRRYQLMLINPPLVNFDVYSTFAYQSRMMGVQVGIRDSADAKEISNLIADPHFEDGIQRWPKDIVDAVEKARNG